MLPFFDAIKCQILLFTTIYGNSFLSLRNRIELIFGGEGYINERTETFISEN